MSTIHSVHVVPHIDDEASGPSYSVPRLCQSLVQQGHRVGLMCLAGREVDGVELEVHRQWPVLQRFALSPAIARAIGRRADEADIVHNHSLWSMSNVAAGLIVPGRRARLVTSPRGTLSPWALSHSRWVKRGLWPLQRKALTRADLLHATSDQERDELRALGFTAPIAIIANGVDIPDRRISTRGSMRTLLFLSRIHPKKGIDRLLEAWRQLQAAHPGWRLQISGSGHEDDVADMRELAQKLEVERVQFTGPLYGQDKSAAFAAAHLFVLPTHSENFGMAVAEALAAGCPAIVSHGAPWSGLGESNSGWWVEHDQQALVSALDHAMRLPEETLAAMGARGRAWMQRDFSWAAVGQRMAEAYRWLLAGGEAPAHVGLR